MQKLELYTYQLCELHCIQFQFNVLGCYCFQVAEYKSGAHEHPATPLSSPCFGLQFEAEILLQQSKSKMQTMGVQIYTLLNTAFFQCFENSIFQYYFYLVMPCCLIICSLFVCLQTMQTNCFVL
eukprot:TRINITY_DN117_c1_g1_i11.p4 TRINITY_DN117_c1_g1~~TRINITY_DN117_c1_g1_i11.p4  ORF type:complete len:124 (-),score=8.39 TRINITY_DN117_c1_g1_i11:703-1074(-)